MVSQQCQDTSSEGPMKTVEMEQLTLTTQWYELLLQMTAAPPLVMQEGQEVQGRLTCRAPGPTHQRPGPQGASRSP